VSTLPFDLVIFDCDGVLVDSESITNRVFAAMLNEIGLRVTLADMFDRFVGHSMAHCLGLIEEMLGHPPPPEFAEEYRRRTRRELEDHLRPVRGVENAIREIAALGLSMCVASSGDHDKMRTTLGTTGLLRYFDGRLFSVTEVERGKPNPDVFLYAARRMGVEAERTAVVEDTGVGVRAGVAAGMTVFGYAEFTQPSQLVAAGAALTVREMHLLPELVRTWRRGKATASDVTAAQ
jgi:HAD superfamily hydrolase (TIGR01509 family)